LIKKTPWTAQDIDALIAWSDQMKPPWRSGKPNDIVFHRWLWLPFHPEVLSPESSYLLPSLTLPQHPDDILTDDRPFWLRVGEVAYADWFRPPLLFGATVLATLLWWWWATGRQPGARWMLPRVGLPSYFLAIGLGYMALEVALTLWLQLYLGYVLVSWLVTIGGLLTASALTSWWFRERAIPAAWFWMTPLVVLAACWGFRAMLPALLFPSVMLRGGIALVVVAVVGASLGVFFPHGMRLAAQQFPGRQPILVGLNGGALAAGVPVSFYLASLGGISSLVLGAAALYGLCAALMVWMARSIRARSGSDRGTAGPSSSGRSSRAAQKYR
jgi:hypothetical protein